MRNSLVISILGENRPGVLETVAQSCLECSCSIAESRMCLFEDRLTLILLLRGTWDAIAKIETQLIKLKSELDLNITSQRTNGKDNKKEEKIPYAVEIISVERPSIIHSMLNFFLMQGTEIEEMTSSNYRAVHTGTPMFCLNMTVSVSSDTSIASMRTEFLDFCDQQNFDAVIEPAKY
jgi:glycine cleavage system transcriptional repressor